MADDLTEEGSAISEIASFFFDLGTRLRHSNELYTICFRTCNFQDLQQAVRSSQDILNLLFAYESISLYMHMIMPTILFRVMPRDLLYILPIVIYIMARSYLHKFIHKRQVEDVAKAIEMFRTAYGWLIWDTDKVRPDRCLFYLCFSHLERDGNLDAYRELGLPFPPFNYARPAGLATLESVMSRGSKVYKTLCDNLVNDDELFPLSKLREDDELFPFSRLSEDDEIFRLFQTMLAGVNIWYFSGKLKDIQSLYNVEASLEDLDTVVHSQVSRQLLEEHLKNSESAIELSLLALKILSSHHARKGVILTKLGEHLFQKCNTLTKLEDTHLFNKFKNQSKLKDLDNAIECSRAGLEYLSPTSQSFGPCLINMTSACSHRFQMLQRQEDLDDAIRYAKRAWDIVNSQDPTEKSLIVKSLNNLAEVMSRRYFKTGDLNALNAAIDAVSRVVDTQDRAGHPDPMSEKHLSVLLGWRFDRSGRSEDISEAVAAAQKAVDLLPNDSRVLLFLINLADLEFTQYIRLQNDEFLLRGAQHVREAWAKKIPSRADDETIRYCLISSRATAACLLESYKKDPENVQHLETVIAAARFHISTRSPMAVHYHEVLCDCLLQRWKGTSDIKYIDEAINVAHDMIELTKTELCELTVDGLVQARKRLGKCLRHRHEFTRCIEDRENALAVLLEGFRMSGGRPSLRIQTAQLAIDILSELGDWDRACRLSREILDLFVILNGRSLSWQDKRYWMRACSYRASTYASIALEAGNNVFDVINMLETCRGSILGHVIDSRTDLNDLMEAAPEKAKLFSGLIDEINIIVDPRGNMNDRVKQTARRIEAEKEIFLCLQEIRAMKGFHNFMLGPTEEELKAAATRGPILIVNISSIRSDAIIITEDEIVLFHLPELKYEKAKEYLDAELTEFNDIIEKGHKNRKYRGLLAWLWNTCVKHIFKRLDDLVSGHAKLHVWWIGVGIASSLPFHAAGIYTGGVGETALSRAISSYVPTIKILIHCQRKLKDDPSVLDAQELTGNSESRLIQRGAKDIQVMPQVAVIIMPSTPGSDDLKGVKHEAEEIQRIVHDTYTSRILLQPSAKDTMEQMAKCEIVHFACHAESTMISDPSGSHLLLGAATPDSTIDKLTLKDVAAADLGHGKLAFLSASSTAEDSFGKDMDEALHLASGFQVAGYLHAIGNLWQSDDEVSVQVVKEFYRHLVAAGELGDGENVAKALNKTLMGIAGEYVKDPLSWAQFVHFGV